MKQEDQIKDLQRRVKSLEHHAGDLKGAVELLTKNQRKLEADIKAITQDKKSRP